MCTEQLPVASLTPSEPGPEDLKRGPFAAGQIVGGVYRIDGVLGSGGMGVVYAATDTHLPRRVALKTPLLPALNEALLNEAQALAAIQHPAFPAIHQFGYEGEYAWFAMERIFGEPLEARLRARLAAGQPLAIQEVLDLLVAITDALSAAHRMCVTHRDLKPSNVLLSGERVVLIDLGLFIPEPLVGPENLVAGSVQTIAPEVVLRSVVRGRSPLIDLYALGALAYELLTGRPPFTGDSETVILARHVCDDAPDPRDARADVPAGLALLVRSLLAKNPIDRPTSSEAVLWQLKELRGDGTIHLRPTDILVVDDDPTIAQGVRRVLQQSFPHLSVRATSVPEDALPGHGPSPDILVLDVNMPDINGVELCMAFKALPEGRRPSIIAMSGSASPDDIALLRELGVKSYVPKGDALFREVGNAVGRLRMGKHGDV